MNKICINFKNSISELQRFQNILASQSTQPSSNTDECTFYSYIHKIICTTNQIKLLLQYQKLYKGWANSC